jgi:very-short-patch-repair endonuclease
LEAKVWFLLLRSGVPRPVRQHWVVVPGGRYRLDFAWPELRVGLECDGWAHHGDRVAFGKDRDRFAELAAARWRVLPVTWRACSRDPERVIRWIRDAVAPAA